MNKLIILIPVYKNKNGLEKTLHSLVTNSSQILFDVLVIDDSPEPELEDFDFSTYPFNVTLLVNGDNLGIIQSLNNGLNWIEQRSNYTYFARLDAGDEAINDRMVRQLKFMEKHPDCVLVSGAIQYTSDAGKKLYTFRPPVDDETLRAKLHLNNFVPDAAAMMRIDSVLKVGGYDDSYPIAEGYDIAWKLSKLGKLSNLPEVILNYEVSPKQTSRKRRSQQIRSRISIQWNNFDFKCFESYWGLVKSIVAFLVPWERVIYFKSLVNAAVKNNKE